MPDGKTTQQRVADAERLRLILADETSDWTPFDRTAALGVLLGMLAGEMAGPNGSPALSIVASAALMRAGAEYEQRRSRLLSAWRGDPRP